jgi:hypothetical protein
VRDEDKLKLDTKASLPQKYHSKPVTSKLIRSAFFKKKYDEAAKLIADKITPEELEQNPELKAFLQSHSSELVQEAIKQGFPEVVTLLNINLDRKQFYELREAYTQRVGESLDNNALTNKFKLNVEVGLPQKYHSDPATSKLIRSAFFKEKYAEAAKLIADKITPEELEQNPELKAFLQSKGEQLIKAATHLDSLEVKRLKICLTEDQSKRLQYEIESKALEPKTMKSRVHRLRETLAQAQEAPDAQQHSKTHRELTEAVAQSKQEKTRIPKLSKAHRKLTEAVVQSKQKEERSTEISAHLIAQTEKVPILI